MKTINRNELKNLDSTKSSIDHFEYMGWTLSTHYMEITTGMMSHLVNWHGFVPENGKDDIEAAIIELAPHLA
jgi:hypothetical protein